MIIIGATLVVFGGIQVIRERDRAEAIERLSQLLQNAKPRAEAREPDPGSARVVFVDQIKLKDAAGRDLDSLRETAPADEMPRASPSQMDGKKGLFYVRPGDGEHRGNGSEKDPWRGLQHALDQLKAGDTLKVLGGTYKGNFEIDIPSGDGSKESRTTILFNSDALLLGFDRAAECQGPVLTLNSGGIYLGDLSISPLFCEAGFRIGRSARAVEVASAHIFGGAGHGVVIDSGARGIIVRDPHLHHLGNLQGRQRKRGRHETETAASDVNSSAAPLSAAIKAFDGDVTVFGGKIHNHFGVPLLLLDEMGEPLPQSEIAQRVKLWQINISGEQAVWW